MVNSTEHIKVNEIKWDKRADTYDLKIFDYFRFMQKKVIDQLNIQPNSRFLDLGCGTGWAVHQIANKLNGDGLSVGIDISEGMLKKARQKTNAFKNISFVKSSSDDLPFEDDYFDFIICTNSFHHYPEPEKTLAEVKRVLKTDGQLHILDVTNDNFLANLLDIYFRNTEKEHVKFYNSNEYLKMFSISGLKHISSKNFASIFHIHCAIKLRSKSKVNYQN